MESNNRSSHKLFWFFAIGFSFLVEGIKAKHAENDDWLLIKAKEARKTALNAYHPEPANITEEFNFHVHKHNVWHACSILQRARILEETNSNRRQLGWKSGYTGPCEAQNPIDRCWRCRANWEKNRKKLAKCAKGFGRGVNGGLDGPFYIVWDGSDDDVVEPRPGTLRHAVIQEKPLWVIFNRSMVIKLQQELIIQSDKTIDARGSNVHIAGGAGITIQFVKNIIIHGLHIHDIKAKPGGIIRDSVNHFGERTPSDGDGISVFGSSHIWLDHLSMRNCQDGLIDAISGSTAITISNSHFTHHNESLLFGARDEHVIDNIMQITLAFNHFGKGLIQRMPRCRRGFFHVVNNDYTHWEMYAIGGSANPTIISQGNRFIAPLNQQYSEITHRNFATEEEWKQWTWRSEGDLMLNGAFFVESGEPLRKLYGRLDMIKAKPGSFVRRLTRFAGTLRCRIGAKC